jgi:hypothetical protein
MKAAAAALAAGAVGVSGRRRVLFAWFEGGWDTRCSLDAPFGEAMRRMEVHRDVCSIVRGVDMGTLSHDGCLFTPGAVKVATGLDTHFDGDREHEARQRAGWDCFADLLSELRNRGALAQTTVVAFSELGRSDPLNAFGGRDHARVTSLLIAGAGIRSGQVVTAPQPGRILATAQAAAGLLPSGEPLPALLGQLTRRPSLRA